MKNRTLKYVAGLASSYFFIKSADVYNISHWTGLLNSSEEFFFGCDTAIKKVIGYTEAAVSDTIWMKLNYAFMPSILVDTVGFLDLSITYLCTYTYLNIFIFETTNRVNCILLSYKSKTFKVCCLFLIKRVKKRGTAGLL